VVTRAGIRGGLCVLTFTVGSVLSAADAAPAKDAPALKAEREAVRQRAERARQAIAAAETRRQDTVEAIAEADRALSDARRRQVEAERARDEARAAQALAQAAADDAARGLRGDQARLARLVAARNAEGAAEPLKLWLSGREPSEVARLSAWLSAIGRARVDAIERWRLDRERHAALAAAADAARRAHDETTRDVAREAASVEARRREHAAVLARVSAELKRQRVSLDALARDEARLRALLERLARPAPPREARRDPASSDKRGQPPSTKGFGALRGLPLPVRGELIGRFGVPREGSGAPSRGWFIESAAGADVRAVAAGQVVWADWLRGFGNLLILDHGDGYMTLYGHNEALVAAVGATVARGEAVAQAGASGGAERPGVYFEIRYDGRAVDPAPWFARDAARQ
jgi:septal ring factor EnvC (AmiA/AmiB activator)